jgi:hypothetical protein
MTLNEIDKAIIDQFGQHREKPQSEIVRNLLPITSEGYAYARIRQMEGRGLLEKTGDGNRKVIVITQAGKALIGSE